MLLMEAAYRVVSGKPVFVLSDWRSQRVMQTNMIGFSKYHPLLGWTLRENLASGTMNTIAEGIRKNRPEDSEIRVGGLLAVGDSFTAGSEVGDAESWPAQLERMVSAPVVNAGVGGYGTDQILLRAELLMPVVRPHTLIVGFLEQDILRAGFSVYGRPKPYFKVEGGTLVHYHNPVPHDVGAEDGYAWLRRLFGHSLIVHELMSAYFREFWYSGEGHIYRRISNDEIDVTCALLARVKSAADVANVRTLLLMQYGSGVVQTFPTPPERATMVNECAVELGVQVVDEFESLKAVWNQNQSAFRGHYIIQPDGTTLGHMSAQGNAHIAGLVAEALRQPPLPASAAQFRVQPSHTQRDGDGVNRVPMSESLDQLNGTVSTKMTMHRESMIGIREFRLAVDPGPGEHYFVITPDVLPADQYVLSIKLRAGTTHRIRVQLLDAAANGVLADVNLKTGSVVTTRVGKSRRLHATLESGIGGWHRLWVTAALPEPGARVLLQVQDVEGRSAFDATGETIFLRQVQLEAGGRPSKYVATSGPLERGFFRGVYEVWKKRIYNLGFNAP